MIGRKEIRAEVIQTKPTSTGTDLGNPNWEQEGQARVVTTSLTVGTKVIPKL